MEIRLVDENGAQFSIDTMQGGVISPSGELLYIVAGYYEGNHPTWGIHVFEFDLSNPDLPRAKRVQRSSRSDRPFKYEFHPGGTTQEEPEGITIWDLDDDEIRGRLFHYQLRGQLHVLLLDNGDDDVILKHYTNTINVDRNYTGTEEGTPEKPFKTVGAANDVINELNWNGAQIKIRAGSYPEAVTFSKRIRVLAERGTVTIGR
ncbi:MAG: hypothetical protein HY314_08120 [Acidobacteria bacterium]|nr:hypothetical protein [Acidobacteriota bacterium]